MPGVTVEQRVEPLARVGCYVPGGRFPLPSSLLMTAVPARVAGVREVIAVCPRPEPAVMAAALEAGVTRLFRIGGAHAIAALAYGTDTIPRVDKIVGPGNRYVAAAKALVSADCAIDFYAGPTEIVIVAGMRPRRVDCRRSRRAGRARSGRAIDLHHLEPPPRRARRPRRGTAARPAATSCSSRWRRTASSIVTRDRRRSDGARQPPRARASGRRSRSADRSGRSSPGRCSSGRSPRRRPATTRPARTTCCRPPGAARFRGGLSAADFVRVMSVQRADHARGLQRLAPTIVPLARAEGLRGARRIDRGPARHEQVTRSRPELYDGLRLHQNENTGGCSPRVLEALAALRAGSDRLLSALRGGHRGVRAVPRRRPRSAVAAERARRRDHGRCAIGYLRPTPDGRVAEAIIPEPAFEIFAFDTEVVGGRRRSRVMPQAGLSLSARRRARGDHRANTGVVFLTNPEQPDRRRDAAGGDPRRSRGACRRRDRVRRRGVRRFLRRRRSFPSCGISQRHRRPHVLEGVRPRRAADRRCSPAQPDALEPIRLAVPVYSVNVAAVAARAGRARMTAITCDDYLRQVEESKALLYAACDRLGLHVLEERRQLRAGAHRRPARRGSCDGARGRGIYLRDRSDRAGLRRLHPHHHRHRRAHPPRASPRMEEVLCAAR